MANGWKYHEMCLLSTKWVYFDIGENKTYLDILSIVKYYCDKMGIYKKYDWSKLYLDNVLTLEIDLDDFMGRKPD